MKCWNCGLNQADELLNCIKCGSAFSQRPPDDIAFGDLSTTRIEFANLRPVGLGILAAAILLLFFPFITFIFTPIITIVHELGHTITNWLFGYPAVPAFDFVYGGGVTIHNNRQIPLVVVVFGIFCYICYYFRKNRLTLAIMLTLLGLYSLCALTTFHEVLILFMGHGLELVIATIFLFRAWSGRSIIHAAERPLYAFIGFYIVFYDIRFAYQLFSSAEFRLQYEEAKGGGHWMDFSRIAEGHFGGRLTLIALLFLGCCFLPPVLSFLAFLYQARLAALLDRLLSRE